jgi:hypothetical protein
MRQRRAEGRDCCGLGLGGYAGEMLLPLLRVIPLDFRYRNIAGLAHRTV